MTVEAAGDLTTPSPPAGRPRGGPLFDAPDFLHALTPHLTVRFGAGSVDAP
ncbi:hypothetical protein ABZV60_02575 [Streptomyces sp. NPDC004787]|uniref:hypothetical protein n=1 Tax=Streptomyces sp. NPDC004787 TaxID=3154291 RepID=UPI0033A17A16